MAKHERRDKDRRRRSRSRSPERNGGGSSRKRKSHHRSRSRSRSKDRRSSHQRRRRSSHSAERDTSRRRSSRDDRDRDRGGRSRRDDLQANGAKPQDDVLKKLAASLSAKVLEHETAQLEKELDDFEARSSDSSSSSSSSASRGSKSADRPGADRHAAAAAAAPRAGGAGAAAAAAPAAAAAAAAPPPKEAAAAAEDIDEEKRKRKERLRAWQQAQQEEARRKEAAQRWQEQPREQRAPERQGGVADGGGKTISKMSLGWKGKGRAGRKSAAWAGKLDDEDEEDDRSFFSLDKSGKPIKKPPKGGARGGGSGAAAAAAAADPWAAAAAAAAAPPAKAPPAAAAAAAEEVDPLDAFMTSLQASTELVAQDTMSAAFGAGDGGVEESKAGGGGGSGVQQINPYGTNTISLEDIMRGGRRGVESWESDVAQSDMDEAAAFDFDDEDEETAAAAEEVDPLDAFMTSLQASTELVAQDTMSAAFGAGDGGVEESKAGGGGGSGVQQINPYGTNTISLEDIMRGGRRGVESWESDVAQSDMDEAAAFDFDDEDEETTEERAAREAREEQERVEFMAALRRQREEEEAAARAAAEAEEARARDAERLGRMWASEGDIMDEGERAGKEKDALAVLAEQMKKKELKPVDHAAIDYLPIRKNLYIVPRALAALTSEQVQAARAALEIKIRGKGCPPPVETWEQCGLRDRVLAVITRLGFGAPFAIQRQALPALMSGRDVIGVARTGSGKTLAFLLPLFRHILDQPPLGEGEGPIGLIMAPARELAVQIYTEAKKFTKALGLRVTAVYGGAMVADQIGDLKRGAEIVVCTPGRMIDILTMQAGKLVSLARVSFVVMDEADRMFDMGFEPQIRMILQNVRPDRQTALFSATFPPKVEALARKVLRAPLEIIVGGRSVASESITQHVEVREEDDKYMRLLQLLGVWYERGNVLVFVDTQQKADSLFQDLTRSGYPALSLHGGKDQTDRDFTISDFKSKARTLMVATSVAGRGLDVPDLVCVINYSCPNHLEDYVHRVGRTGRAGRSGTAYTFIAPEEEAHAPTLVKALQAANQPVPPELQAMADAFGAKVASGLARKANSGFSGKGFTFDDAEQTDAQKIRSLEKRQYEIDAGLRDAGDLLGDKEDEEAERRMAEEESAEGGGGGGAAQPAAAGATDPIAAAVAAAAAAAATAAGASSDPAVERARALAAAAAAKMGFAAPPAAAAAGGSAAAAPALSQAEALQQAKLIAQSLALGGRAPAAKAHFEETIDINDYPQQARWKVTQSESIGQVEDTMGVAIVRRGIYTPPGKKLAPGEEKLHLRIEGSHKLSVQNAKAELQRMLNEETLRVAGHQTYGKYQVV